MKPNAFCTRMTLTQCLIGILITCPLLADDPQTSPAENTISATTSDTGSTKSAQPTPPAQKASTPKPSNADASTKAPARITTGPRALSRAFRFAAKKATPSVVTVFSYGQAKAENFSEPTTANDDDSKQPTKKTMTGIGSGVIVGTDGLIITNNHVIDRAQRVVVQLSDESEIEATVFRGDPDSDVGMIRIERDTPFVAAGTGNSDDLEVGDWVLAIGSPFRLEATVSAGIISAKNRPIERIRRGRLLQTDAAINPGNSGGPLIDLDGNVIGISTAIATRNGGYQGIGFAVPINHANWIASELDEHELVRRAAIGAQLLELKPKYAKMFNKKPFQGVLVYQVIKGSVAEIAGFQQFDLIIEFAGERVVSPETLQEVIERKPIGSMQKVKVDRDGEEVVLEVELATVDDPTPKVKAVAEDAEVNEEEVQEESK